MNSGIIACGVAGFILAIIIIREFLTKDKPNDRDLEC